MSADNKQKTIHWGLANSIVRSQSLMKTIQFHFKLGNFCYDGIVRIVDIEFPLDYFYESSY